MIFPSDELLFVVENMKFLNYVSLEPWIPAFAGMTLLPLSFPRKRESTFQIAPSSDPVC